MISEPFGPGYEQGCWKTVSVPIFLGAGHQLNADVVLYGKLVL